MLSRDPDPGFFCPECEADVIVATWAVFYGEAEAPDAVMTIRSCSADPEHPEPLADPTV